MTGDMLSQNTPVSFQCPPADTLLLAARGAVSHVVDPLSNRDFVGLDMFAGIPGVHQLLQLLHRVRFAATIGDGTSAAFNPIPQPP
jgi:hypothetical protein